MHKDESNHNLGGQGLLDRMVELAREKKGANLVALDVSGLVYYTDIFLIISGHTDRHVKALAGHLEKMLAQDNLHPLQVEGNDYNRWVLLDYGEVIIHLFVSSLRDLYELEKLWSDAPQVKIAQDEHEPDRDDETDSADDDDLFAEFE